MKRAVAFILAVYIGLGSLFPHADFSQLPKVIYAFQHFQQHRAEESQVGREVSLWLFAKLHFFQPQKHQPTHEHSQMPFHSFSSSLTALTPCLTGCWVSNFDAEHHQCAIFSDHQVNLSQGHLTGIFRPPLRA